MEKLHQVVLFLIRQLQRNDEIVLVGILDTALVVEIDDFFKRLETPVVHVRSASSDLPQGGGLECAKFLRVLRDHVPAKVYFIVIPADAEVVKLFVGEIEPGVALGATCLLTK